MIASRNQREMDLDEKDICSFEEHMGKKVSYEIL